MYSQAYLIIAHRYDKTFKTLLQMLDSAENDIFVHMDKKNKQFDEANCRKLVRKANLFFTERTCVTWGGYSQINSELLLLEAATSYKKYNYYHLLSGQDLPIKTNDYIKEFFINNQGREFVAFDKKKFDCRDRVQYYYPFQEIVGRNRKSIVGKISSLVIFIQKNLHLKRNRGIFFQKGANWFSITDDLAKYVIGRKSWIRKVFGNSLCCDEVFLQTLVVNSPFFDRVYQYVTIPNTEEAVMRLVDWKRGGPYVFRAKDYQEIINSKMLFARKFDCEQDENIVKKISSRGK